MCVSLHNIILLFILQRFECPLKRTKKKKIVFHKIGNPIRGIWVVLFTMEGKKNISLSFQEEGLTVFLSYLSVAMKVKSSSVVECSILTKYLKVRKWTVNIVVPLLH